MSLRSFLYYGGIGISITLSSCASTGPKAEHFERLPSTLSDEQAQLRAAELKGGEESHFVGAQGESRTFYRFSAGAHPKAIVIGLHGLASHAGWLASISEELSKDGFEVWTADRFGTATNAGGRVGDTKSWKIWTEDLHSMVELAEQRHPKRPIVLWGYSLGGITVAAYLGGDNVSTSVRQGIVMAPGWATETPPKALIPPFLAVSYLLPFVEFPLPKEVNKLAKKDTVTILKEDPSATPGVTLRYLRQVSLMQRLGNRKLNEIDVPVGVILADYDTLIDNEEVESLAKRIPDYQVYSLEKQSHLFVIEEPKQIANTMSRIIHGDLAKRHSVSK